jgi:hypothetical protein
VSPLRALKRKLPETQLNLNLNLNLSASAFTLTRAMRGAEL